MSALQLNVYVRGAWRCVADDSSSLQPPALKTCGRHVTGGRLGDLGTSRAPSGPGISRRKRAANGRLNLASNNVSVGGSCRCVMSTLCTANTPRMRSHMQRWSQTTRFHFPLFGPLFLCPVSKHSSESDYLLSRSANAIMAALMVDGLNFAILRHTL